MLVDVGATGLLALAPECRARPVAEVWFAAFGTGVELHPDVVVPGSLSHR